MKFESKPFQTYNYSTLWWYSSCLAVWIILAAMLARSDITDSELYLIYLPITWLAILGSIFICRLYLHREVCYLTTFADRLLVMPPLAAREHMYTFFIVGPGNKRVIMTECLKLKEVNVVISDYKPLFPKLFYTQLIRELQRHGERCRLDISDPNTVIATPIR